MSPRCRGCYQFVTFISGDALALQSALSEPDVALRVPFAVLARCMFPILLLLICLCLCWKCVLCRRHIVEPCFFLPWSPLPFHWDAWIIHAERDSRWGWV